MPQTLGVYDVYGTLGKGTFSRIRFAVNRENGLSYAIKMFDKSKLRENGMLESTRNEIAIMKSLDHKHCVGIRDMFASKEKIYLVLDLMMGGSLRQKLNKRTRFREERARKVLQVLTGVIEYVHGLGITLGGVSLEGILLDSEGVLKISDFSCASVEETAATDTSTNDDGSASGDGTDTDVGSDAHNASAMNISISNNEASLHMHNVSALGAATNRTSARSGAKASSSKTKSASHHKHTCTPYYMAPEMVEHNIPANRATDIWSLGVVLYAMCAGTMPFDICPTLPEMLRNIRVANYASFPEYFSDDLKDLLEQILVADPTKRAGLQIIQQHQWTQWDRYLNADANFQEDEGNGGADGDDVSADGFSDDEDVVGGDPTANGTRIHGTNSTDGFVDDHLCSNALKSLPLVGITEFFMAPFRLFQSAAGVDTSTKSASATNETAAAASEINSHRRKAEEKLLKQYVEKENAKSSAAAGDEEHNQEVESSEDGDGDNDAIE
jgi:serine/threonine protein kinase